MTTKRISVIGQEYDTACVQNLYTKMMSKGQALEQRSVCVSSKTFHELTFFNRLIFLSHNIYLGVLTYFHEL